MKSTETIEGLLEKKLGYLREYQQLTQQGVLLVDLDNLDDLFQKKDQLIEKMQKLDEEIEGLHIPPNMLSAQAEGMMVDVSETIQASLENEVALEERIREEQAQLRHELQEIDRETRLKRYLERQKRVGGRIDLKQ